MSLINQMLRDLEARRKERDQPQADGHLSQPTVTGNTAKRWFCLILLGVALGSLGWFVSGYQPAPPESHLLEIIPAEPITIVSTIPPVVDPTAKLEEEESIAVETVVEPIPVVIETAKAQPQDVVVESVSTSVKAKEDTAVKQLNVVSTAPSTAGLNIRSPKGVSGGELLALGVVEGLDSIRFMFEFEKIPAYRVQSAAEEDNVVKVSFEDTVKSSRLEIPPFRGPLLTQIDLARDNDDVQLLLGFGRPVKVDAYVLPADGVHGDRLLLELSVDRQTQATPVLDNQTTMGEMLRGQKESLPRTVNDSVQQAEILYRKALRYLEQGNEGAAKIQLSRALDLTPGNVELRLRLIDMLLKRQQSGKAENLLISGLTLAPENPELRTYYGRLLFSQHQVTEALDLMMSKPVPAVADQPDYHALLAALEQENGKSANAATRYRELLKIRPQQGDWWMMLGIAYEQLNDGKLATSSYRQALGKNGLSTEHRKFALERLERLQRLQK